MDTHHKTLMTNQICNMTCMCYRHAFQVGVMGGCGEGQEGGGGGGEGASDTWHSSVWHICECTPENSGGK